jgi:NAD(P)H-nitrite reductase large subunit
MRHVVIGAGPAGITAAETLRKRDPAARITVLDGENERPYARMAIPYLLSDRIAEDGTRLRRDPEHYRRLGIEIVAQRATAVETTACKVRLGDGSAMPYDCLLIATGSQPSREDVEGIDLPGVHACWTLADARAIIESMKPGTRVVQMGAGFVGCIIMQGLVSRGAELTILIRSGRMVSRMMPPKAGDMIARWCAARGVKIMGKTQTARIERDGGALRISTTTGEALPADLYLSVVGVKPGIDFLAGSGIEIRNGIVVDESMRTNLPGVFAAGDVAESRDCLYGQYQINAIQPNAVEQAHIAAINMAGGDAGFAGSLAMNVLDTLGLISCSFGQWQGEEGGESVELVDAEHHRYLSLQFSGDRLIGATAVGRTEHIGALRGLIQHRVPLGPWRERLLADPSQFMPAYLATMEKIA